MKRIAIIGAGQMAKIFAQRAKRMNIETFCFAWAHGAEAKEYVTEFFDISIFEIDKITNICKKLEIEGVLATTELTVSIANTIAENLKLNHNKSNIMNVITNKEWVRNKTKNAKLFMHPKHQYLSGPNAQIAPVNYPVIVKPTSEGGKRGIKVAYNADELNEAIEKAFFADKKGNGILIEEFISEGKEFSIEGLSYKGNHQVIQITQKISSGAPHCVELGHSQPAELDKGIQNKIVAAINELLSLVEYDNGASHTEIKVNGENIYLIELNSRPGGDHIAYPLTQLSSGYDYIAEIIKVSMNIEPIKRNENLNFENYAGVRFITKQTEFLKEIFDTCDAEPWLYKKHVESKELQTLDHNNGAHTNYFIYCSKNKPAF